MIALLRATCDANGLATSREGTVRSCNTKAQQYCEDYSRDVAATFTPTDHAQTSDAPPSHHSITTHPQPNLPPPPQLTHRTHSPRPTQPLP